MAHQICWRICKAVADNRGKLDCLATQVALEGWVFRASVVFMLVAHFCISHGGNVLMPLNSSDELKMGILSAD